MGLLLTILTKGGCMKDTLELITGRSITHVNDRAPFHLYNLIDFGL